LTGFSAGLGFKAGDVTVEADGFDTVVDDAVVVETFTGVDHAFDRAFLLTRFGPPVTSVVVALEGGDWRDWDSNIEGAVLVTGDAAKALFL
jgi:hypothetical protein